MTLWTFVLVQKPVACHKIEVFSNWRIVVLNWASYHSCYAYLIYKKSVYKSSKTSRQSWTWRINGTHVIATNTSDGNRTMMEHEMRVSLGDSSYQSICFTLFSILKVFPNSNPLYGFQWILMELMYSLTRKTRHQRWDREKQPDSIDKISPFQKPKMYKKEVSPLDYTKLIDRVVNPWAVLGCCCCVYHMIVDLVVIYLLYYQVTNWWIGQYCSVLAFSSRN